MRLGKKLKAGLKLGAKIGAGVIGAAGVVGAGLFALGSKASPSASTPSQDFMSGTGSIANVSTADLDKLYPRLPRQESGAQIGTDSQGNFTTSIISRAQPRQESTASIIRKRVNDVPAGFIPPPTGNQNFVGGAINPLWN